MMAEEIPAGASRRRKQEDIEVNSAPTKPTMVGRRLLLLLVNAALIAFGAALIKAGTDGRKEIESLSQMESPSSGASAPLPWTDDDSSGVLGGWMLGDPYTSLIACGAFVIVVSLIGIAGALTKNLEVLFWFYAPAFVLVAVIVYLGSFCFVFAADQDTYVRLIAQLVTVRTEATFQMSHAALIKGGAFSLVTAVLLMLGLWISSSIMGHEYALRSMAQSMNIVTLGFGVFILYLAILTSLAQQAGQYAAILVAFCGAVTSTFSLIGFCGLAKESRLLLLLHALLLLVIALTLVAAAIMCFVLRSNAEEYVRSHWNIISAKLVHISMKDAYATIASHLLLIGVASIILVVCLVYNLVTSMLLLHTNWRRWASKGWVSAEEDAQGQQMVSLMNSKQKGGKTKKHKANDSKRAVAATPKLRRVSMDSQEGTASDASEDFPAAEETRKRDTRRGRRLERSQGSISDAEAPSPRRTPHRFRRGSLSDTDGSRAVRGSRRGAEREAERHEASDDEASSQAGEGEGYGGSGRRRGAESVAAWAQSALKMKRGGNGADYVENAGTASAPLGRSDELGSASSSVAATTPKDVRADMGTSKPSAPPAPRSLWSQWFGSPQKSSSSA